MLPEMLCKSMDKTPKLRQNFPLREITFRHVVEGKGRYPRSMTPSYIAPMYMCTVGSLCREEIISVKNVLC